MKTYYQFLGINEDADEAMIRAAYRKCMLRIHPDLHPDDHHAQETAQQLNEAFRTLLNDESRETYDDSLRRQRESEAAELEAKTKNAAAAKQEAGAKQEADAERRATDSKHARATRPAFGKSPKTYRRPGAKRGPGQKRLRTKPTVPQRIASFLLDKIAPLIVGLACSSVVVLILYCVIKGKHPLDIFNETKTSLSTNDLIVDLGEDDPDSNLSIAEDGTGEQDDMGSRPTIDAATTGNIVTGTVPEDVATNSPTDVAGEPSIKEVTSYPIGLSFESDTDFGEPSGLDIEDDHQYQTDSQPASQTIRPIPSDRERAEALKLVTAIFKERYGNAKSNPQKRVLAREIFGVGLETHDDVAGMYELLRIALEMAIDVGDIRLAEQVVDSISQRFEVDQLQAKLSAFEAIEGKLIGRDAKEHLYFASLKLVDRFESADAYDEATKACKIAAGCANSLRNPRLSEGAKSRSEQLDQTQREFRAVEKFVTRQALDAADVQANLEVGKYLCFWKGQWDRGLTMLAASSDPVLRHAAAADIQTIANEGALDAGEKWWAAADGLAGHESEQARARAVMFYQHAHQSLDGLNRMKIEHRIDSVDIDAIAYMKKRVFAPYLGAGKVTEAKSGFVNSIGMKLIRIPAGQFEMGSLPGSSGTPPGRGSPVIAPIDEQPRHTVTISRPFYMGISEVTVGQFAAFVRETGQITESARDGRGGEGWDQATKTLVQRPDFHWNSPGFPQTATHPVVLVSWNDASEFCQWLSGKENRTYRLPTEAEWEYACRAGTQTRYQHADIPHDLERFANVLDSGSARALAGQRFSTSGDDAFSFTAPVGSFLPNRFGLFDMHGNAWEWCHDFFDPAYYASSPAVDPKGPSGGSQRTLRGGAFLNGAEACRSANRQAQFASVRTAAIGFRVVVEVDR